MKPRESTAPASPTASIRCKRDRWRRTRRVELGAFHPLSQMLPSVTSPRTAMGGGIQTRRPVARQLTTLRVPRHRHVAGGRSRYRSIVQILEPIWTTRTETAARVRGRYRIRSSTGLRSAGTGRVKSCAMERPLGQVAPGEGESSKVRHYPAMPWCDVPAFMADSARTPASAPGL